jgi:hypothetical protein
MSCESVEPSDSRYPGWYCCRDNTFNTGRTCRICREKRDSKVTEMVVPRPRRKREAKR